PLALHDALPIFTPMEKSRQLVCAVVYRKRFSHFKLKAGKHEPAFNLLSINPPQFITKSTSRYDYILATIVTLAHVHAADYRNCSSSYIGCTVRSKKR